MRPLWWHLHPARLRRLYRKTGVLALAAGALYLGLVLFSPWPPLVTLKHIAALPTCAAARAVGLAPASKGEPGYWSIHDPDGNGTACEPWERYGRSWRKGT